jgi:hypothetical protein
MKNREEKDQKFRILLKSIADNNQRFFSKDESIFNSYQIIKEKIGYKITVLPFCPQHIKNMIESAFLEAYKV